ncbi:uncharacterized protein EAF01_000381 [Botrytis porri]|uniref:uncharacterized protein n=1 Tax=Botrytis porri TaxID=87229 RepID=UPI0019010D4A|nr:uncharacterized protein EAF01_000381 [Botrytis porri]KAF7913975.1 hypothetical protein EAF01_000381 [Botrytis porri]
MPKLWFKARARNHELRFLPQPTPAILETAVQTCASPTASRLVFAHTSRVISCGSVNFKATKVPRLTPASH